MTQFAPLAVSFHFALCLLRNFGYSLCMRSTPPVILSIAGFDPSSGAGITADIKTIAAHQCYGVTCITSLTVQSTLGVRRVHQIEVGVIAETLAELVQDVKLSAVKIGMLGTAAVVNCVADFLAREHLRNVVLDPILKSSSGANLLDEPGRKLLIEKLLPLCTVVTPNLDEASVLTGLQVTNVPEMKLAARKLHEMGAKNVVVTGGHLDNPIDVLSLQDNLQVVQREFACATVISTSTHGTGCALSSSIACHLALGKDLMEAVALAKAYVAAAIANAYPVGRGIGPLHHLFRED